MISVPSRPFARELISGLMLPDGIFESTLGHQQLNAGFRNDGGALADGKVYVESVSHPALAITPATFDVGGLAAGATRLLGWDVDVTNVPAGTHLVSFVAETATGSDRMIKKIFVTRVTFDPSSRTFHADVPEGRLDVRLQDIVRPRVRQCCDRNRELSAKDLSFIDLARASFQGHDPEFELCPAGYLLHELDAALSPVAPYAGQYGDLPFQDPWWKIVLAIIAALLALASAIVEAASSSDDDGITVSGSTDEEGNCCGVSVEGGGSSYVAAGLLAAAATVAVIAAASDIRDPFRRGEDNTAPQPAELTTGESVHMVLHYPEPVALGRPFEVGIDWEYTRETTGSSYAYQVSETNENLHVPSSYAIHAPDVVIVEREEAFIVSGEFHGADDVLFSGGDLFVQCIMAGPRGEYLSLRMQDDGLPPDDDPDDGTYTARHYFSSKDFGLWAYWVIAQDVNHAPPDMTADEAAQYIGGAVITQQLTISFEGGTCPLVPDGFVHVISRLGS